MEELLACVLLCYEGVIPRDSYRETLDALFLEDPEDELLQELEWSFSDWKGVYAKVREYCAGHRDSFRMERFGRPFMARLRALYETKGQEDIRWFAGRMYDIWEGLPPWLQDAQPFWTLCYADDPLSWGDEKQTREIYEEMLGYYEKGESDGKVCPF